MNTRTSTILFSLIVVLLVLVSVPAAARGGRAACLTSDDCAGSAFCGQRIGACTHSGTCVDRPTACSDTFTPVCGCNGQTYGNECQAAMAGVSVAALGPCEAMACVTNRNCPSGFMCHSATGACGSVGVCSTMPVVCSSFMYMPVCGCDGKTYDNVCMATLAGMSVDSMGVCPGTKCETSADCAYDGLYCQRSGQRCEGRGRCEPKPEVCYDLYAPVCGCDGETYANSCYAAQTGVVVDHAGECRVR